MKIVVPIFILGLIMLYFLDSALKVENLNLEMFTHSLVRFFSGFAILGIWVFYKNKLKLKIALYFVLALLISDDIMDYLRHIDNLSFEMVFHDTFLLVWGAVTGFFYIKSLKRKQPPSQDVVK